MSSYSQPRRELHAKRRKRHLSDSHARSCDCTNEQSCGHPQTPCSRLAARGGPFSMCIHIRHGSGSQRSLSSIMHGRLKYFLGRELRSESLVQTRRRYMHRSRQRTLHQALAPSHSRRLDPILRKSYAPPTTSNHHMSRDSSPTSTPNQPHHSLRKPSTRTATLPPPCQLAVDLASSTQQTDAAVAS